MSDNRRAPFVLFVTAAGPERGFGHLVRAGVLADAIGASRQMVLRGPRSALHAALAFGWTVHRGRHVLRSLSPDLVIVDDPSPIEVRRWIRLAHAAHIPIVAVRDGGTKVTGADLTVDGSLTARPADRPDRVAGPAFAILRRPKLIPDVVSRDRRRVLVALGGGSHVRRFGAAIARAIAHRRPDLRIEIARGFTLQGQFPALPTRCRWVSAPGGLDAALKSVGLVVVAGGVTLYEACAWGAPTVAVPVVAAQRSAIAAAAARGAVLSVPSRDRRRMAIEVATAVEAVLDTPGCATDLSTRARAVVDGGGTVRVAARIWALLTPAREGRWRRAA
jgi:spore coat polysaccharide biosynthesis predicted glycosyltransferase SpsG